MNNKINKNNNFCSSYKYANLYNSEVLQFEICKRKGCASP